MKDGRTMFFATSIASCILDPEKNRLLHGRKIPIQTCFGGADAINQGDLWNRCISITICAIAAHFLLMTTVIFAVE